MWTPRYSEKQTLVTALTGSLPKQTHLYSRSFGNKFIDSLVEQTIRTAKS